MGNSRRDSTGRVPKQAMLLKGKKEEERLEVAEASEHRLGLEVTASLQDFTKGLSEWVPLHP